MIKRVTRVAPFALLGLGAKKNGPKIPPATGRGVFQRFSIKFPA
jgi:hypothetical protein